MLDSYVQALNEISNLLNEKQKLQDELDIMDKNFIRVNEENAELRELVRQAVTGESAYNIEKWLEKARKLCGE